MDVSDARKLKSLEQKNARLKRLLADAMLDNVVLRDGCLNEEVFQTLAEARSALGRCRCRALNSHPPAAARPSLELRQGSAHAAMATRANNDCQTKGLSK